MQPPAKSALESGSRHDDTAGTFPGASTDLKVEDPDQRGKDQVARDDIIEEFRQDEDANPGDERHNVAEFDSHL
jgi:hypothetical protein